MTQRHDLITDEDSERIRDFVADMRERVGELPRTIEGRPIDNHGAGAYLEQTLFTGVTLVLHWHFLDAPSSYLVIEPEVAPGYKRQGRHLPEAGDLYDDLDAELADVLDGIEIEYDTANSAPSIDVWHIHGAEPF